MCLQLTVDGPTGCCAMLGVNGVVHLSASDLVGHLNCQFLTKLDLAVARGELDKPLRRDPVLELLAERGALHEQSYLDHLELSGLSITRVDGIGVDPNVGEQTLDAMRQGVPVIAQGALGARRARKLDARRLASITRKRMRRAILASGRNMIGPRMHAMPLA
jgi:hypothetical protein